MQNKMNKIKYILVCICVLLMYNCTTEEKDIFEATPAERINEALKSNLTLLTDATNGWIMEYYANPTSAGYPLIVKFNISGSATFAAKSELTKNKAYETDSSLFEIIADYGPVLTFNTFNKVLHRFSNPEGTGLEGFGLEGDYEFIIMKSEINKIILKGKKYGATVILNKIITPISWTQYYTDLEKMDDTLFGNNAPDFSLTIGSSIYKFSKGSNHIFSITKISPNFTPILAPFIVTTTGIKLYAPLELEGTKIQHLTLNNDKSALISIEDENVKISGPEDLALYFNSNIINWKIIPEKISSNFKTHYDALVQSIISKYDGKNINLFLKYYSTRNTFVLSLSFLENNILKEGNIDLTITQNAKNSLLIVNKGNGDTDGNKYYTEVQGFREIATLLSTSFSVSSEIKINPQEIKIIKKTDANTWINLMHVN